MQIIFLDPTRTLIVDIASWVVFHLSIGYFSSKIPVEKFNPKYRIFQSYACEKDGKVYEDLFHVRSWKHLIPDGSVFYRGSFSVKKHSNHNLDYLTLWLKESIRAEICHWTMVFPGFFFFLLNNKAIGWLMVAYAFLNNIFPIMAQRYNRPRMRKLITRLERENLQQHELPKRSDLSPRYAKYKKIS